MTRRAELGQWFTAAPIARLAIAALGGISPDERVIDPTCGDGAFLAAALAAGARHIVGIEIDPSAAERARELVAIGGRDAVIDGGEPSALERDLVARTRSFEVVVSDVLAPDLVDRLGLFDVAIGNPPYVRAGRVDPAIKRERARVLARDWPELDASVIDALARHADVSATCLLRTLRFVRPGGRAALVVSTALLDADGASALWDAIARIASIEALIVAPGERWFADAAVNPMLLVVRCHATATRGRLDGPASSRPSSPSTSAESSPRRLSVSSADSSPRLLRLAIPTSEIAGRARSLDDIARASETRALATPHTASPTGAIATPGTNTVPLGDSPSPSTRSIPRSDPARPSAISRSDWPSATTRVDVAAWGAALRAPSVWFAWCDKAHAHLVPLRELCDVRRGLTTGANDVFYVPRDEAKRLRLEKRFLAPVVRSPFNGAPAPIAIAPDESPLLAIVVPPDAKLARAPRIKAWLDRNAAAALATSAKRRDPWWSLPVNPARLFFAKAYGPRFVQRLADTPMLADQRVYALHPKPGVDLVALAAVLNALPTALALESLGRRAMGYGVVEWTVHDAFELPVLDVRRASATAITEMTEAMRAIARRPVGHVRLERNDAHRRRLDRAALALAEAGELLDPMWDGLCASVAQRDRYLLPAV